MASFRKSLAINFASSSGATLVMFVVSIIVARILTPAEIGIYSIAIVLVNVAHVFREFGVSSYLQRAENLTPDKVRSAMGVAYASPLRPSRGSIKIQQRGCAVEAGYSDLHDVMCCLIT